MKYATVAVAMLVLAFTAPAWAETSAAAGGHPVKASLDSYFTAASDNFQTNKVLAVKDIRAASTILKMDATKATGTSKDEVNTSIQALDKLQADVQKGAVTDKQQLEQVFAKAREAHQHVSKS
ncbi:MAG TPA: hypothetical protein VL688_13000 [Verrucomicrobiae bacterium]|nr:hypothetical protein [Verrucomicrobiae bacterium]